MSDLKNQIRKVTDPDLKQYYDIYDCNTPDTYELGDELRDVLEYRMVDNGAGYLEIGSKIVNDVQIEPEFDRHTYTVQFDKHIEYISTNPISELETNHGEFDIVFKLVDVNTIGDQLVATYDLIE